jgi:hypothetical protein
MSNTLYENGPAGSRFQFQFGSRFQFHPDHTKAKQSKAKQSKVSEMARDPSGIVRRRCGWEALTVAECVGLPRGGLHTHLHDGMMMGNRACEVIDIVVREEGHW